MRVEFDDVLLLDQRAPLEFEFGIAGRKEVNQTGNGIRPGGVERIAGVLLQIIYIDRVLPEALPPCAIPSGLPSFATRLHHKRERALGWLTQPKTERLALVPRTRVAQYYPTERDRGHQQHCQVSFAAPPLHARSMTAALRKASLIA